jgi:AcrR family transcriptional regulator
MTTGREDPPVPVRSPIGDGTVAFEDLTARARIREAALAHFAEEGYERATIREIARTAGVSAGLLRHHYGSKDALRVACDDYVFEALRHLNSQILSDPASTARAREASKRFGPYIARSLAEGSATAAPIFDEMVTMTDLWLARADESRAKPPAVDRRVRAALVTAMAVGIPLLHEHVSRALGADMFEPEGDRTMAVALLDIYTHPLLDEATAASIRAGFGRSEG